MEDLIKIENDEKHIIYDYPYKIAIDAFSVRTIFSGYSKLTLKPFCSNWEIPYPTIINKNPQRRDLEQVRRVCGNMQLEETSAFHEPITKIKDIDYKFVALRDVYNTLQGFGSKVYFPYKRKRIFHNSHTGPKQQKQNEIGREAIFGHKYGKFSDFIRAYATFFREIDLADKSLKKEKTQILSESLRFNRKIMGKFYSKEQKLVFYAFITGIHDLNRDISYREKGVAYNTMSIHNDDKTIEHARGYQSGFEGFLASKINNFCFGELILTDEFKEFVEAHDVKITFPRTNHQKFSIYFKSKKDFDAFKELISKLYPDYDNFRYYKLNKDKADALKWCKEYFKAKDIRFHANKGNVLDNGMKMNFLIYQASMVDRIVSFVKSLDKAIADGNVTVLINNSKRNLQTYKNKERRAEAIYNVLEGAVYRTQISIVINDMKYLKMSKLFGIQDDLSSISANMHSSIDLKEMLEET